MRSSAWARVAGLLLLTLTGEGCEGDAREPADFAVRDSAGVRIAVSEAAAWGPGQEWRITQASRARIGQVEGPETSTLHRVVGAVRLSDGRIAVGNGGSQEVRIYDRTGQWLSSAGGRGEGPGEFEAMRWIGGAGGDSIAVYDQGPRRVSIFDPDGALVRTFRQEPPDLDAFYWPVMLGRLDGGPFVIAGLPVVTTGAVFEGVPEDSVRYLLHGADGRFLRQLLAVPASERWARSSERRATAWPVPFGRLTHAAVADTSLYVGTSDRFEIRAYGSDGRLRQIVRKRWQPPMVETEDVDRYWEAEMARGADRPERRRALRELSELVPSGETVPAFESFLVDDLGCLWVENFTPPGGSPGPGWTVFDSDGRLLGTLPLPAGLEPLQIGEDFVLGSTTDALGVEYVEVYGLSRVPDPGG